MIISKNFKFESAHHLRNYVGKCQFPHGHSYHGTIWIDGTLNSTGFVMDYGDSKIITDSFDHKDLNELPEFKEINPTAENIARIILLQLLTKLNDRGYSVAIKLHETESSSAFETNDNNLKFLAV